MQFVDRKGIIGFRYHLYFIPGNMDLKNVVEYAYGESMKGNMQDKGELLLVCVDPVYTSDRKWVLTITC